MKSSKALNIIIVVLLIANLLPLLAPILMHIGANPPSKAIYFIYSFFCHQFHHRSLHIYDHQCAWCARDTGIWAGWLIGAVALKYRFVKPLKFLLLPLFIIPIALDGGIQSINTITNIDGQGNLIGEIGYVSNNLTRFITGSIFGIGISLWFIPFVLNFDKTEAKDFLISKKQSINKVINKQYFRIFSIFVLLMLFYISIVFIWNNTSKEYKPTNWLDSKPKVQNEDFFQRRTNGQCPTSRDTGPLELDCFW